MKILDWSEKVHWLSNECTFTKMRWGLRSKHSLIHCNKINLKYIMFLI